MLPAEKDGSKLVPCGFFLGRDEIPLMCARKFDLLIFPIFVSDIDSSCTRSTIIGIASFRHAACFVKDRVRWARCCCLISLLQNYFRASYSDLPMVRTSSGDARSLASLLHDLGAMFRVFLLADPHLVEAAETTQHAATDECAVLALHAVCIGQNTHSGVRVHGLDV